MSEKHDPNSPTAGLLHSRLNLAPLKRPRRFSRPMLWSACVLLLLGGTVGYLWHDGVYLKWRGRMAQDQSARQETRHYTVGYGALRIGLVEEGQLRAMKSVLVTSDLKNPAKIAYLVPEGSKVQKDKDVLIRFESKAITDALVAKNGELNAARQQLVVAQENVKIEQSSGKAEVSAATAALRTAKAAMDRFTQLDTPRSFRDMEAKIVAARKSLVDAQKALRESQRSLDEEMSIDEEQRKTLESQVESAKGQAVTAQMNLETLLVERKMLKNYDYPRDAAARKQDVQKAELDLAKAQVAAQSNLLAKQTEVAGISSNIERISSEIDELNAELTKCEKKAPVDGLVLYGDAANRFMNPQTTEMRVGTEIYAGQVVLTIPDLSAFEVDILVGEEIRGKIDVGCKGTVAIEAVPGLVIDGELSQIDSLAQPSNPYDPTSPKGFKGVVHLMNNDSRMISGMTARVELVARRLDHVLTVPLEAVFSEEGKTLCYARMGPDRYRRQGLSIGESNEDYAEILSGLKEGDQVALSRPAAKAILEGDSEVSAPGKRTSGEATTQASPLSEPVGTASEGTDPNGKP